MRYIGAKKLLLSEIESLLNKYLNGDEQTFLDLFAGTNVVGAYFKKDFTVYSNDLLYFSYVNAKAVIEGNKIPDFKGLKFLGVDNAIDFLNRLQPKKGYFTASYSPDGNAMYFTSENAQRVDAIREQIELWHDHKHINDGEYYYLLSALIEAVPFVSNITGTYGAFLKHWDKRVLNPLLLEHLTLTNNGRKNKSYNRDANELVKEITADIVYIDTPYNNRQYASNYHVLENIARFDKPDLKGVSKIFDWSDLKSDYATKGKALDAMDDLISNVTAHHLVLSYNTEGIISVSEMMQLLNKHCTMVDCVEIPYRKYQSKIASKNKELHELLFYASPKKQPKRKLTVASKTGASKISLSKQKYVKSPLNYIGGKYKLLPQIIPLFPNKINTFIDLFSGGANVGINVDAKKHIFNDMNYLINDMFKYFCEQNPLKLVEVIEKRIEEFGLSKTNESAYLLFREQYNKSPNPLDLYVLSSYSYNYQFRFNNNMQYNNPFGRNRSSFSENMKKNLLDFIARLQQLDAHFVSGFYDNLDLSGLGENDFVYIDPPYLLTTGSYNDGNRGFLNWSKNQELKLYDLMKQLHQKGVKFAFSNVVEHKGMQHELLQQFIKDNEWLNCHHLNHSSSNSSYNTAKQASQEVLITNY